MKRQHERHLQEFVCSHLYCDRCLARLSERNPDDPAYPDIVQVLGEPETRYSALVRHDFSDYRAPVKLVVIIDDRCEKDTMHLAINGVVVAALTKEVQK